MILRIYIFIVWVIALPLAGLMIVSGGVLLLVSGGNPKLADWGKSILWNTFWGLVLIFGSWLIIDIVLKTIGYSLQWNIF